jgi:antagonist of KipI
VILEILEGGYGVTVQDAGRRGHADLGIPESGAMDCFALQVANLLAGNKPCAAGLEIPSAGLILRPDADCLLACAGPGWSLRVNGRNMRGWMALLVRANDLVEVIPGSGRWGYLAVAGGLDVPPILDSRSTNLRGSFGGLDGRTLQAGDRIPCLDTRVSSQDLAGTMFPLDELPPYGSPLETRVIPGPEADFIPGATDGFFGQSWHVGSRSDRMGYALEGVALKSANIGELITTPIIPGVIQVPPGGAPLVLMRDAQTTGGYARVAVVIGADLGLLAQLRPEDETSFKEVSLEDARLAASARRKALEEFLRAASD